MRLQANPEMMNQAMDMFSKMDPETLRAMTRNLGTAEATAAGAPAGSMPGMPPQSVAAMQQMMNDPQVFLEGQWRARLGFRLGSDIACQAICPMCRL